MEVPTKGKIILAIFCLCLTMSQSTFSPTNPGVVNLLTSSLGLVHNKPPPTMNMSTPEMITYFGYPVETHTVDTTDGYILTLFRIPHGKNNNTNVTCKGSVIIQHGLFCSSDDWFFLESQKILPLELADDGYDVWMGNIRGNTYSQAHKTLSTSDQQFWNFSFHEMGIYDVPAMIDYVIEETEFANLTWIGHSMGTTMFFIAMDRCPYLQAKVNLMIALAPVAYLGRSTTPGRVLTAIPQVIMQSMFNFMSGGRVIPAAAQALMKEYAGQFCSGDVTGFTCNNIIYLIAGYDPEQTTNVTAALVTGHTPSSTSIKTLLHYFEFMKSFKFQEYNYGPSYNLGNNNVSTYSFYADNDILTRPLDVFQTVSELGNLAELIRVPYDPFTHLDYTYGKNASEYVYTIIRSILATQFENLIVS